MLCVTVLCCAIPVLIGKTVSQSRKFHSVREEAGQLSSLSKRGVRHGGRGEGKGVATLQGQILQQTTSLSVRIRHKSLGLRAAGKPTTSVKSPFSPWQLISQRLAP